MDGKFTEKSVVLLKRETEDLSAGIHNLIVKKGEVESDIRKTEQLLNEKRSDLVLFESMAANHLRRIDTDIKSAEALLTGKLSLIAKAESLLKTLRSSIHGVTPTEEKFTLAQDVVNRLKGELNSLSGRFATESSKLFEIQNTRHELESMTNSVKLEIGNLLSRRKEVQDDLETLNKILEQGQTEKDKRIAEGMSAISQLDTLTISHIERLKSEQNSIESRKETLEEDCARYETLLGTLKQGIASLEIPKPDFSFERQVAAELTSQIDSLVIKKDDAESEVNRLASVRKDMEAYIERLIMSKSILADEVATFKKERDDALGSLESTQEELFAQITMRDSLLAENESLRSDIVDAGLEKQIAEIALEKSRKAFGEASVSLVAMRVKKEAIEKDIKALVSERKVLEPNLHKLRSDIYLGNDKNGKLGLEYLKLQEKIEGIKTRERQLTNLEKRIIPMYSELMRRDMLP